MGAMLRVAVLGREKHADSDPRMAPHTHVWRHIPTYCAAHACIDPNVAQNGSMSPSGSPGTTPLDRISLHLAASRRLIVEPDDVYVLEADGDDTIVRRRGRRTLRDVRRLAEIVAAIGHRHFYRIHDNWAVNLRRIREIRPQRDGRDWEVVMQSPVNRVLPVSRGRLQGLLRQFEQ